MQRLPNLVWLLGWISLCTDFASEMLYPVVPLFLVHGLGASPVVLGIIEGSSEALVGLLKGVIGRWSDGLDVGANSSSQGIRFQGSSNPSLQCCRYGGACSGGSYWTGWAKRCGRRRGMPCWQRWLRRGSADASLDSTVRWIRGAPCLDPWQHWGGSAGCPGRIGSCSP